MCNGSFPGERGRSVVLATHGLLVPVCELVVAVPSPPICVGTGMSWWVTFYQYLYPQRRWALSWLSTMTLRISSRAVHVGFMGEKVGMDRFLPKYLGSILFIFISLTLHSHSSVMRRTDNGSNSVRRKTEIITSTHHKIVPILVAARSKAWICARSLSGLRVRIRLSQPNQSINQHEECDLRNIAKEQLSLLHVSEAPSLILAHETRYPHWGCSSSSLLSFRQMPG